MNNPLSTGSSPKTGSMTPERRQLLITLALVLVSLFLWNTVFIYPAKVFVVFLHEISHGLTAVFTGGSIVELRVFENEGGQALTRGGLPILVVSSGYIGSMILGGLLLLFAIRPRGTRTLGVITATALLAISLLYVRNTFGIVFGATFALALGFAALKLPQRINQTILQWLGALSCLYALLDIKDDLLTLEHRQTDAQILAQMTGIPAIVWGIVWSALAVIVFYFIGRRAWRAAGKR